MLIPSRGVARQSHTGADRCAADICRHISYYAIIIGDTVIYATIGVGVIAKPYKSWQSQNC